ncbi:MAG: 3-phosphoshikimate 1-carboxyvinyltransferase [Thermotogota bacterium]|nr:3-phosphoshikimate 1-carboxyvinyltransferase [Thermotogota bacterium]MDK2865493.1 3-phosphoshikimate 1-carboxyvinyltransferase [Thermotogota bacterium]HCZ06935.1 3-phosphoshikimate 1-carboxyvinyltransferase [Thermotogota bacterium]
MKRIERARKVRGRLMPPPDKSLSHRALIFSAVAEEASNVENLLDSGDTRSTYRILEKLGVKFEGNFGRMRILPPRRFEEPFEVLDCGNSGTTARLMTGLLSSLPGFYVLSGDASLSRRPMKRVVEPLRKMGAVIMGRNKGDNLPLAIYGSSLHGCVHELGVASAQVKSALLLAGLRAEGTTVVIEPRKSRDHTERLLSMMGARINVDGLKVEVKPSSLKGLNFRVPGDFSSAAFFIALGVLHPDAELTVEDVNLNPTRTGFLSILEDMGADVSVEVMETEPEPVGRITVRTSSLNGTVVSGDIVVSAIDELPLVALLGTFAHGETVVMDAQELRRKESDRIKAVVNNLRALGVKIEEFPDGFSVVGPQEIEGGNVDSHGDHRIAMMFAIAGLLSKNGVVIENPDCVYISFPQFFDMLEKVVS